MAQKKKIPLPPAYIKLNPIWTNPQSLSIKSGRSRILTIEENHKLNGTVTIDEIKITGEDASRFIIIHGYNDTPFTLKANTLRTITIQYPVVKEFHPGDKIIDGGGYLHSAILNIKAGVHKYQVPLYGVL